MNININPYIGPRTFRKEEGHLLFGREREARDLIALTASEKLVLFYAQSGAGKSSVVNARLIPALENKGFEVLPIGRVIGDTPMGTEVENIYIYNLIRSLAQHDTNQKKLGNLSLAKFLTGFNSDEQGYYYDKGSGKEASSLTEVGFRPTRRVLIIDQFEELLSTHVEAWVKREDFFIQLAQAIEDDPYLWVILVMREDYVSALDPYAHLLPGGLRGRYYMQRLGRDAALSAIKKPVENLRPFEAGVAEILVDDLARINIQLPDGTVESTLGQYVEPVQLQVMCYSLWQNLEGGKFITLGDLHKLGDVNQALEQFYNGRVSAVAKDKNVEERQIREWFNKELITPGGIRNLVLQGQSKLDDSVIQALLGDLVQVETRAGQIWYELSHDRLVEPVYSSNAKWFDANLSIFQRQATLWSQQGRPDGMLLRGNELEQAEKEAGSKTVTRDEADFLEACKKARQREIRERRANQLARILTIAAIIATIFAVSFAAQSQKQSQAANNALNQERTAVGEAILAQETAASARGIIEAKNLADQARIALEQPDTVQLGQLLAVEAYKINAKYGDITQNVYQALFDSVERGEDLLLSNRPFTSAAFSPETDQRWLVIDGLLYNLTDRQSLNLALDSGEIIRSAFQSEEDVTLITRGVGYYSNKPFGAYTVNAENQNETPIPLDYPDFEIENANVSENGRWIIAYGINNNGPGTSINSRRNASVLLWDVNNPDEPKIFNITEAETVQNVAITEDGKVFAVATQSNLYLWRDDKTDIYDKTRTLMTDSTLFGIGFQNGTFTGKSGNGLQISPDGNWLTLLTDHRINLYDTKSVPALKYAVPFKDVHVLGFLFSQDSKSLILITSNFQSCRRGQNCQPSASVSLISLTDINPKPIALYESTTTDITAMMISKDGNLFIGDEAGYIRIWDLTGSLSERAKSLPQVISAHAGKIIDILVSADGQTIVSASTQDGTRLWKLAESTTDALVISRVLNTVSASLRSEDGNSLVVGGINTENNVGNIHIYTNLDTPNQLEDTSFNSGHGGNVDTIAVSDLWVAAARTDKQFYSEDTSYYLDFWARTADSTAPPSVSFKLDSEVSGLAFHPNGQYLAIATSNGDIWVDVSSNLDDIRQKTLSMTSKESTSNPGTENPQLPKEIQLTNDLTNIQSLFFTRNGRYLIAASTSGIRIWDTQKLDAGIYSLPEAFYPVIISPDQKQLVAAGANNTIQLFDLSNLSYKTITPSDQTPITSFTFSPGSDQLAVANKSGQISIYQLPFTTNPPVPFYILRGATGNLNSLEFSPAQSKGSWLAASSGYSVFLWNLAKPNEIPIILRGYNGLVVYAGFANNGEWIVTVSEDQTIRFWSMDLEKLRSTACKYAGRNMKIAEWNRYLPNIIYDQANANTCSGLNYGLEAQKPVEGGSTPAPESTLSFIQPPTSTPIPSVSFIFYTVQANDTLSDIALRFGLSISTLMEDNNITDQRFIAVGQSLKIRVTTFPTISP